MYSGECLDDEEPSGSAYFDEMDSNSFDRTNPNNFDRTNPNNFDRMNSNNFDRMNSSNAKRNTLNSVQHLQMTSRHRGDPTHPMQLGKIKMKEGFSYLPAFSLSEESLMNCKKVYFL
jgi:hypothetical protein